MKGLFAKWRGWLPLLLLAGMGGARASGLPFRPPDVPLVPVDPYFSIWSPADQLTDAATTHWTEAPNRLTSLVKIDGKPYRIMGDEPREIPALPQTDLEILPTTVRYTFEGAGVRVSLTFLTPLLPDHLMVLSRPVTYLTWQAVSTNGNRHDLQVYYDNTTELVVNNPATEKVVVSREKFGEVETLKLPGGPDRPVGQIPNGTPVFLRSCSLIESGDGQIPTRLIRGCSCNPITTNYPL